MTTTSPGFEAPSTPPQVSTSRSPYLQRTEQLGPEFVARHIGVSQFLAAEVVLLDENRLWEWFELLEDDFHYEVPIRVVRERGVGDLFPAGYYRQRDNKATVKYRIQRLDTGHGWAEDPASRIVRVLGPVSVTDTEEPNVVIAQSSLLLYREQFQDPHPDFVAGRREDRIRFTERGPRLASRIVYTAHPTLNTSNLGMFL